LGEKLLKISENIKCRDLGVNIALSKIGLITLLFHLAVGFFFNFWISDYCSFNIYILHHYIKVCGFITLQPDH
jgi:membrane-bound acyltransferase YfiQ involved in biofilm formation